MLEFNNVTFLYDKAPVLSDLSLTLEEGNFYYLIGKSGAGKTTLFQLIYFNLFPGEGSVSLNGFNTETIRSSDIPKIRKKLGIVFQDFKLLEDKTVSENLDFVLRITGTGRKERNKKILKVLADVGLSHKIHNFPNELSGGEKQRVAIARAIINDPVLLLADEPTGNLDPETSAEIMEILHKINARGTTVLLATHNYNLVKKAKNKILKLENGKIIKVVLKQKSA
ncbi:MAG: cell division ATP-binding protein FtsE [Melioribacteraceae bacterium]|nr:MAG: cell division ATP-binding protein FtsE [Melioribacteraceae bacterium]